MARTWEEVAERPSTWRSIGGRPLGLAKRYWAFTRQKPLGGISLLILGLLVVVAIFAPFLSINDPYRVFVGYSMAKPGTHPPGGGVMLLGGDEIGRDLLSRTIYGSRISLWVGIVSVGIGTIFGSIIGLVSGFYGGKLDMLLQRAIDSLMAYPMLILALTITSLLGASITNTMIAIGIVLVPVTARVVRGATLSVKQNIYIDAARAIGSPDSRVLFVHILPNVAHTILILAPLHLGGAILVEASLSFLSMGTPPPTPSWGGMIAGGGRSALIAHPILMIVPGATLSLTVMSFNLLGDALRDVWDPRLRTGR